MGLYLHPPRHFHGVLLSTENFIFLEYFTEYFNGSFAPDLYSEGTHFNLSKDTSYPDVLSFP